MSNGVNGMVKEASVDQESEKLEEDKSQEPRNKEDTDGPDADKLAKGISQTEKISNKSEKEAATIINSDMDVSPKFEPKSVTMEGNATETPVTGAQRKHSAGKYKVAIKYDESLIGTKVKVWWRADNMYYQGVVSEFYPTWQEHKVSYVDGDVERLDLRKDKWKILKEFYWRDVEEQNTAVQSEQGSPEIHKKKKSKTDHAASQEKIKDSPKNVLSSGKSKGSTAKDDKSTKKTSGKSAPTTSKEATKSKEDEEALKTISKMKTVNKSKGKILPSSNKSDTNVHMKAEKIEGKKLHLKDKRLKLEAEKLRIKAEKVQNKIRQEDETLRLESEKMKLLKKESNYDDACQCHARNAATIFRGTSEGNHETQLPLR